jgi:hypothetical protein
MRVGCASPEDAAPAQQALGWNRQAVATLALLSFAMLLVSLDQSIVIVALPARGRALGLCGADPALRDQR